MVNTSQVAGRKNRRLAVWLAVFRSGMFQAGVLWVNASAPPLIFHSSVQGVSVRWTFVLTKKVALDEMLFVDATKGSACNPFGPDNATTTPPPPLAYGMEAEDIPNPHRSPCA